MSADKLARGMPYIVAEKVTKSFGSHQVLKGVSTQFCTGEVTVIIGASGSGKSTLLRAINRLEPGFQAMSDEELREQAMELRYF